MVISLTHKAYHKLHIYVKHCQQKKKGNCPREEMGEAIDKYQLTKTVATPNAHEKTMSETWQTTTAVDGREKCDAISKARTERTALPRQKRPAFTR